MISHVVRLQVLLILTLLINASFAMGVNKEEKKRMDQARLAFEKGRLEQALQLYEKIPQSSDFWVEALEERAWTQLRKGNIDGALSLVTTLTSDLLAPQIGPEPYFLKGLINYRLCNIQGIFKDFELFRNRYKSRQEQLEALKDNQNNNATTKALNVFKSKKAQLRNLQADDFGLEMQFLPRYFYRDPTILAAAETNSERRILKRLSQLAEAEVKEIKTILQKMHLLESQVVQQVFAYNKEMHEKREAEFQELDADHLVFPYKYQNDIWIDELDSFEAATSDCPVDPLKGAQ
jgi:hypothetical protein